MAQQHNCALAVFRAAGRGGFSALAVLRRSRVMAVVSPTTKENNMDVNSPEAAEWSDHMRRLSDLEFKNSGLREALEKIKVEASDTSRDGDARRLEAQMGFLAGTAEDALATYG